jgi:hypothetical protein
MVTRPGFEAPPADTKALKEAQKKMTQ